MPLIKSHSNYVLKKKHQLVTDGTIYERDITTIGAVNQFAPGQIPIYRSGNFIITVRDDRRGTNQYNTKKWEKGIDGETWTLTTVENMTSKDVLQDDTKIVLKNDYYDFREFAYYGSLTELFRASINDVLTRFPGELYTIPGSESPELNSVYYTDSRSEDFERIDNKIRLGGSGYYEVSNPFGINIHTEFAPPGADPLKYFANDGFRVYEVITDDEDNPDPIVDWSVVSYDPCATSACTITSDPADAEVPGTGGTITFSQDTKEIKQDENRKVADITIKTRRGKTYVIYAYLGDNGEIFYLYDSDIISSPIHIRPNKDTIIAFYNECNDLQRIMFAQNTTPKYRAVFSVIGGDDYGYTRQLETFVYPTSEGGYNPAVTSDYINRLIKIGEFYDEYFTDNLYRSMTHESIKNFDWTYTREYNEGDELEYVHGGEKIKKALRIFAREFDEVKKYIDNIKYTGRLTYDGRGNVPDYFLSDLCEQDGWDVESVIPYDLEGITNYSEAALMTNTGGKHLYSQSSVSAVTPYRSDNIHDDTENGYFIMCNTTSNIGGCLGELYPGGSDCDSLGVIKADKTQTIFKKCDGSTRLENRIRPYFDDTTKYTYMDINYEFLRRLKLNSKALWRHKGTLEGIEMILGMFGLKSKRWMERNKSCRYGDYNSSNNCPGCGEGYDYEIIEYTQFTTRIEDKWNDRYDMYEYDWLNSTKTITYDYRSVSNYTKPGAMGITYVPYQGLPVSYRDPYEGETTDNVRYLYPDFNKSEQLDGNPYFQMDGGWLAKTINNIQNFQFDTDDNIVHNKVVEPSNNDGFIVDNHKLYKETVRSIKRVEDLTELLSLPQQDLYDGIICLVGRIGDKVAIIDGQVFDIEKMVISTSQTEGEDESATIGEYIRLIRKGGFIKVGGLYFDESIVVYDENGNTVTYTLDDKFDGYEVKAFIKNGNDFICRSGENPAYTFTNFDILSETDSEDYSNYYMLDDVVFSDTISQDYSTNGWRRLKKTDPDYLKVNTIENYYEGNNGHNGNLHYDSGHEYFTYFQRLFKYAEDNGLFDTRCYREGFNGVYDSVHDIGFQGLINPVEEIKDYDDYLSVDTKTHYYGNYKTRKSNNTIDKIYIYGNGAKYESGAWENFYGKEPSYYSIGDGVRATGEIQPHTSSDDVTNQIVNNKRLKIRFFMKSCDFASKDGQIELKYMDKIVMNYLTQMLPSTVITEIEYNFCNYAYDEC